MAQGLNCVFKIVEATLLFEMLNADEDMIQLSVGAPAYFNRRTVLRQKMAEQEFAVVMIAMW